MLLPAITLNLVAIAIGLLLGFAFKLVKRDCVTLGIEVGVQNSAMAILIAVSFLDTPDYAIAAGVYTASYVLRCRVTNLWVPKSFPTNIAERSKKKTLSLKGSATRFVFLN